MSPEKLQAKLMELEGRRTELQRALKPTRDQQQSIRKLERQRQGGWELLSLVDIHLMCSGPEDKRRIYQALKLQVSVGEESQVHISGVFSPDVYLPP